MNLAPDFNAFFASLIAHRVEFVVVGAHALAFHGAPRFTGDLDVLIRRTIENGARLIAALTGRREFLRNKIAAGRPKDLADIAALGGLDDLG